jgi:hypothetical protein
MFSCGHLHHEMAIVGREPPSIITSAAAGRT